MVSSIHLSIVIKFLNKQSGFRQKKRNQHTQNNVILSYGTIGYFDFFRKGRRAIVLPLNLSHSLRLYVNIGRIGETHGTYQPRCKKYARQTPRRNQKKRAFAIVYRHSHYRWHNAVRWGALATWKCRNLFGRLWFFQIEVKRLCFYEKKLMV